MPSIAFAAEVYIIDGDAPCPGEGTEADPWCSIQGAFDVAAPEPGDRFQIRDAETAYGSALFADAPVGTAEARIVLEPAPGHSPIISGGVRFTNTSYWTIQGLTFDLAGASVEEPTILLSSTVASTGFEVLDNTIVNVNANDRVTAGIAIASVADGEYVVTDAVVARNRLSNLQGTAIYLGNTGGAFAHHNTIRNVQCGTNGTESYAYGLFLDHSGGSIADRNDIADIGTEGCEASSFRATGIYIKSSSDSEIERNLVRRVGDTPGAAGDGISGINSANDNTITHNVVVDCLRAGIAFGGGSSGGERNVIVNNTVLRSGGYGIGVFRSDEITIHNNIVADAPDGLIVVRESLLEFDVSHNLYWNPDGPAAALDFDDYDLAAWQGLGFDSSTVLADPMLPGNVDVADRFTPSATSPAIDAGVSIEGVTAQNGTPVDIGALEAMVPLTARIDASAPATIALSLTAPIVEPLQVDAACAGFVVDVDGQVQPPPGCIAVDGGGIAIELAQPALLGQAVRLEYTGESISDSAAIGGKSNALVAAFDMPVDNESQEMSADGSGTGEATVGGGSDGTTDAPSGASDPEGCACRSERRSAPASRSLLALIVVAFGRRRRRSSRPKSSALFVKPND